MKKQNADPTIPPVPDEELVSPNESPTEADDDPDGETQENKDVREDDDDRQGKL